MTETSTESQIMTDIRLALSKGDVRLFRNNVGVLRDAKGHYVQYGLAVGSADLVGWRTVRITRDMVGMSLAQFVALEVKRPGGRVSPPQRAWLAVAQSAGALVGIVHSVEEARGLIHGQP